MFAVVVPDTVVAATASVADVIEPAAATYWMPVLRVAIELLLLSRIRIDRLSVGLMLSGFEILVNVTMALKAGLTYDVQPSVIVTVRVDTLTVVVMTRDGPNSPTPLTDVKSVVVIGKSDGN